MALPNTRGKLMLMAALQTQDIRRDTSCNDSESSLATAGKLILESSNILTNSKVTNNYITSNEITRNEIEIEESQYLTPTKTSNFEAVAGVRTPSSIFSDNTDCDSIYSPSTSNGSSSDDDPVNTSSNDLDSDDCLQSRLPPFEEIIPNKRTSELKPRNAEDRPNISDTSNVKKKKNKAAKNKNFCFFCESLVLDFARHLLRNHTSEIAVQKIMVTPKGRERNELITDLRKKGNFINSSNGNLKPVKKMLLSSSPSKAASCPYCLGFYSRRRLWRHKRTCIKNDGRPKIIERIKPNEMMSKDKKDYNRLVNKVFPHMHQNEVNTVAKLDPLICAYGAKYLKTHTQSHQVNVVSRKMRELAYVLIEIKKKNPAITNLLQALKPEHFDELVEAAKRAAGYCEVTSTFRDASYAMNVATALKDCCEIGILNAIKKKHSSKGAMYAQIEAELNTTILLIKSQWKTEISHVAGNHLHSQKMNKVAAVPLATDLKLFRDYLISTGDKAASSLKTDGKNDQAFKTLVEVVYCRVMLLCRKRPGELQRLTVALYKNVNMSDSYQEFKNVVSATEAILIKTYKRVVIHGKRQTTPVLFSPDVQTLIELIIKLRSNYIDVDKNNYLFSHTGTSPIPGYKVIGKHAKKAGCEKPENIKSRTLRKHLATICQLFNMNSDEVEQLATFMGHKIGTHREIYRLPDDVYQTSKVAKLLIMLEKGQGGDFKGKSLEEIDIDVDLNIEDLSDEEENIQENFQELPIEDLIEEGVTERDDHPNTKSIPKTSSKPKREIHQWTKQQKKTVEEFFKHEIKNKIAPKKRQVEELIALHPNLQLPMKWDKVKVYVQNVYTKKTKSYT